MKSDFNTPFLAIFGLIFAANLQFAHAQDSLSGDDIDVIQLELDQAAPARPELVTETVPSTSKETAKPVDFSTLGRLAPFKEVSIIQRKFLPKTGRIQLNAALGLVTNDPFFNTTSYNARAGYFFTEGIGIEIDYTGMNTSQRQVTKNLNEVENIITDSLVSIKSYLGAHIFLVPFYGKMTLGNESIVPFDFYFTLGYGTTKVNSTGGGDENPGTYHAGMGQIFAVSKAFAVRWDLSGNFFAASGLDGSKQQFNNLLFSLGFSFFFPEAKYR